MKFLIYDKDYKFIESKMQAINAGDGWQKLDLGHIADREGYVQIIVSCESVKTVWFDDIVIVLTPALIEQENHYDPWGLNLAGIEKAGNPDDKYQYNGIEKEDALGLNLNMAEFRVQDPQLGRLWQVDPILLDPEPDIENNENISPYAWVQNNPVNYSDPLGLDTVYHNKDLPGNWKDFKPDEDQVLLNEVVVSSDGEPEDESEDSGDGSSAAASAVAIPLILEGVGATITIPQLAVIGVVVITVDWLIHPSSHGLRMTPGLDGSAAYRGYDQSAVGQSVVNFARRNSRVKDQKPGEAAQNQLDGFNNAQNNAKKNKKPGQKKQTRLNKDDKSKQNLKKELKSIKNTKDLDESF